MKLYWQILLVNCVIISLLAVLFSLSLGGISLFIGCFALAGIFAGVIDVVIALILFVAGSNEWGQGFLLTGAILLLVGFGICTALS